MDTNGTSALHAGGAGIAATAREPATAVRVTDAPERRNARTAKEQAGNRTRQALKSSARTDTQRHNGAT